MRRRTVLVALTVLAALLTGSPAGATPAQADGGLDYVALGDSYSSGVGAPGVAGLCARSPQGYPALWAASHPVTSFEDATCGGAQTEDVLAWQIDALDAGTDLVTVTIGGNDIGFADAMLTCTFGSYRSCEDTVDEGLGGTELEDEVAPTFAAIRDAAPAATIVVLGYPRLFEEPRYCGFGPPTYRKRVLLNDAADELNDRLAALATGAGLTYVDVRGTFAGHGICGADPWVNELSLSNLIGSFHPNAAGYRDGYLAALEAVIG